MFWSIDEFGNVYLEDGFSSFPDGSLYLGSEWFVDHGGPLIIAPYTVPGPVMFEERCKHFWFLG